ncbi:MAG TPA: ABC transporter substrate-binding protein [Sphingomonas sp.]
MTTESLWVEAPGEGAASPPPGAPRRRRWPFVLVVVALLGAFYAWFGRGAAEGGVLHVGSQRGGTKALMIASGVLEDAPYTVDWSEFPAAQNLQEAIGAGAVDVGVAGDAPFQFAYQSGQPVKAVGAIASRPRPPGALAILVPGHSPIRDVAGLRGKTIATTRGSVGHYLILRALAANGLTPDDVKISFLSPGDTKAAFDSGSIDAWSTWSPYVPTALATGARIVADGATYTSGYAFDVANAHSVETKRALLTDFLEREARAYAWAKTHQRDYAQVLAHETGLPFDIALYHVQHQPLVRVPIDDALKAEERDVVAQFRRSGALAGTRPLDAAYAPLSRGDSHDH